MNTFLKIFTLYFIIVLSSCEFKEDYAVPSWDAAVSAPIASGDLGFDELLNDSTVSIDSLGDKSLTLVFQQDLVEYSFDDLVSINSISFNNSATLGSVDISNISFSQGISFEEVISVDPFNLADDTFVDVNFPPFNQQIPGIIQNKTIQYDATDDFHMIFFDDGSLDFELTNGFDVDP
jgi:hypothetical protein